jgi:hypothetical protein
MYFRGELFLPLNRLMTSRTSVGGKIVFHSFSPRERESGEREEKSSAESAGYSTLSTTAVGCLLVGCNDCKREKNAAERARRSSNENRELRGLPRVCERRELSTLFSRLYSLFALLECVFLSSPVQFVSQLGTQLNAR